MGMPSVHQVLILFYEKHDNKLHRLYNNLKDTSALDYTYRVVRVWEINKDDVVKEKLLGLYPLLPLMNQPENKTPDAVVGGAVRVIETVQDEALKYDLMSALAVLAEGKYSKDIVAKYTKEGNFYAVRIV